MTGKKGGKAKRKIKPNTKHGKCADAKDIEFLMPCLPGIKNTTV
jgi:hypothetical protein